MVMVELGKGSELLVSDFIIIYISVIIVEI